MRYHLFLNFVVKVVKNAQKFCLDLAVRRYMSTSVLTYANLSRCKAGTERVKECWPEEVCMTEVDGNFINHKVNTFNYPSQLIKSSNSHLAVLQVVP